MMETFINNWERQREAEMAGTCNLKESIKNDVYD